MFVTNWLENFASRISQSRSTRSRRRRQRKQDRRTTAIEHLENRTLLTTILFEDFEAPGVTAAVGVDYVATPVDDLSDIANRDYFGQIDTGSGLPADVSYSNPQGSGFYGAQDTDGANSGDIDVVQLDWTGVDISGFANLDLSWFVAEDEAGDANPDWDLTTSVRLDVQIDGGGFNQIFGIEGASDTLNNQSPAVDTNFDGVGDGTVITDMFAQFNSAISTGTTLDIRLTIEDLDAGNEDIAFDSLLLTGDSAVTPPDSFVVDIATDEADGDLSPGDVSLRDAIIAANADPNPSTITFDAALDGTPIVLTIAGTDENAALTGDLDIFTEVTIVGNGSANTLIQAGTQADRSDSVDRVFDIFGAIDVEFQDVTISHGVSDQRGAGIAFEGADSGQLTISGSVLTNNENQGVFGEVGGGGLSVLIGSAVISDTTISNNTAFRGGGVYSSDSATTIDQNSVISGNMAQTDGGGVLTLGREEPTSLMVSDTTFLNNSASGGGGLRSTDSQTTVTDSHFEDNQTVSGAGGAIFALQDEAMPGTMLTVTGSMFLNNSAVSSGGGIGISRENVTVTDSHFEGNSTSGTFGAGGAISAERFGNNGTEVLISGTDFISNTTATNGGAIANTGHHVEVSGGTFDGNRADQSGGAIFTQGDFDRETLLVDDATFVNNSAMIGGAIANQGDHVEVANSTISGNSATQAGGGIFTTAFGGLEPATLLVANSTIDNNTAGDSGGGIANIDDHVELTNTTISSNQAGNLGGGIFTLNNRGAGGFAGGLIDNVILHSSTIVLNKAGTDGGGVHIDNDSVRLTNTIVAGNMAGECAPNEFSGDSVSLGDSLPNIIGDAATSGGIIDGDRGNIVGIGGAGTRSVGSIVSVLLSDNGGSTMTHGLVPGSIAIDAGSGAQLPADDFDLDNNDDFEEPVPVDQRGPEFDRVLGGSVDIGAFEGHLQFGVEAVNPSPRTEAVDSIDVFFDVAINPATFTADDIALTRDDITIDTSTLTVSDQGGGVFRIEGLTALTADDGEYLLTVDGSGIEETGGQALTDDGGALWKVDSQFPPKTPIEPLGSLIYDPVITRSLPNSGDVQNLEIDLDPGQTISVIVTPTAGLQPSVDILDPTDGSVATDTSAAAGATLLIQTVPVADAGTYTISVSGAAGTTGAFDLDIVLNSAIEFESHGGPSNDTIGSAEDINASFINLGLPGVTRGAVQGTLQNDIFYTVQRRDSLLRTIAPTGETLSAIGLTVPGDFVDDGRGLAVDPTTGVMFAILNLDDGPTSLATIDPATAAATVIGRLNINGREFGELEFDNAGNLYAITGGRGSDDSTLFSVDKTDPSHQTLLHTFDEQGSGGLALNSDNGLLYRFNRGSLDSIDVSTMTPTVTDVPVSGDFPQSAQSMTYLGNGEFLLYSGGPVSALLYTINTSGVSAQTGMLDHNNVAHGLALVEGPDPQDLYEFDLTDGDVVSLVTTSSATVELLDASGTLLTTSMSGAANVNSAIETFEVSGTGTYFARVSTASRAEYSLVITVNAAFDLEANNDLAQAQDINGTSGALGHVSSDELLFAADGADGRRLLRIDPDTGLILETVATNVGDQIGFTELVRNPVTGDIYGTQGQSRDGIFRLIRPRVYKRCSADREARFARWPGRSTARHSTRLAATTVILQNLAQSTRPAARSHQFPKVGTGSAAWQPIQSPERCMASSIRHPAS